MTPNYNYPIIDSLQSLPQKHNYNPISLSITILYSEISFSFKKFE